MSITLVTGLWDIKREQLSEGWSRSYQHYLNNFEQLLKVEQDMVIFGDAELQKFVMNRRNDKNTQFILRDLEWFKNNEYYELIQKIRNNPNWFNQTGWLVDSTQSKLEMYNPLVMSKVFLLHDAKILDKFNSSYLFWIDAGLTNTVNIGYLTHDKVLEKLEKQINKFTFVVFPYVTNSEIHGFRFNEICEYLLKEKGADIAFFVNPDASHVSFRKNKSCDVDVSKLAAKLCEGGGHEYAAGGKITETFMNFTKLLTPTNNQCPA